jgi:hypothetical protein
VWLDQSELRGGDAWDTSIRKQIKACALFVPLISCNTPARASSMTLRIRTNSSRTGFGRCSGCVYRPVNMQNALSSAYDVYSQASRHRDGGGVDRSSCAGCADGTQAGSAMVALEGGAAWGECRGRCRSWLPCGEPIRVFRRPSNGSRRRCGYVIRAWRV